MSLIVKLILVGLSCYTVGTFMGPIAVGAVQESKETLSPFLFVSAAMLIASIGYAVGAIRRSPFGGERDARGEYYR
ncbi:hypothetical protein [Cerasicoccus maritimus]|uniref:hypothetical protein n=1 Tax=Cerasicoccus maritimus TaxID=490089 RepID=UPI00285276F5|nr:hypothetical protein [Cerasicoccus maritimus]